MKFRPWPRVEAFGDTPRKRAAFHRKMRDQQEALPLFAEWVREQQPDVDDVMTERAAQWLVRQQQDRDKRAKDWRRARARLFGYGDNIRPALIAFWRDAPYPADPSYLLDMLTRIDRGDIDIEKPPWRWTEEELAIGRAKLAEFTMQRRENSP